jgi:hypothetical protein
MDAVLLSSRGRRIYAGTLAQGARGPARAVEMRAAAGDPFSDLSVMLQASLSGHMRGDALADSVVRLVRGR